MARLNIDERWWIDPRRELLIERIGQVNTDGTAIKMWRLAQEYFRNAPVIPEHIFFTCKYAKEFLEVGLAEKQEGGVYIKGSKEFFRWIKESQDSGRKGGQASANRERDERGRLLPSDVQGSSKGAPSETEGSQPSSSSSSSSSSSAGEEKPQRPLPECLWADPDLREFLRDIPLAGQRAWVKMVGTAFLIEPELHKARSHWLNVGSKVPGDTVATFVNRWLNSELRKSKQEGPRESAPEAATPAPARPVGAALKAIDEIEADVRAHPADPNRVHELVQRITGKTA